MFSEMDDRNGLVKCNWQTVRARVEKVEPKFTKIVDELSPDKNFPIYLAYFPYGALKGDIESTFIPKCDGGFYRLTDKNLPSDILKNLGYGKSSSPLGMVLEKEFEYFIDLKDEKITIPWAIYSPGKFFSFGRNLGKNNRTYAPNGVLTATSGARSAFMLPNIGCATHHLNLQRDFNIQTSPPKCLYDHWQLFKQIIHTNIIPCDWRSCIMYFSENWVNKLHHDKAWLNLKMYLHEQAWHYFEYERCRIYYDMAFSIIQKKRNLKPNPYLTDTARHLFTTAVGDAPGYAPTCDNNALPFEILQKVFVESYGLKKYFPTIMKPTELYFENDKYPVYYSLQNPSTFIFSPKSRKVPNTLFELRELQHIMRVFKDELSQNTTMCADTIISEVAKNIQFNYYHNKEDRHCIIKPSSEIAKSDKRFTSIHPQYKVKGATFATDSPFVRGCISIGKEN